MITNIDWSTPAAALQAALVARYTSASATVIAALNPPTWTARTAIAIGLYVVPPTPNGTYYRYTSVGPVVGPLSGSVAPVFPSPSSDPGSVADGDGVLTLQNLDTQGAHLYTRLVAAGQAHDVAYAALNIPSTANWSAVYDAQFAEADRTRRFVFGRLGWPATPISNDETSTTFLRLQTGLLSAMSKMTAGLLTPEETAEVSAMVSGHATLWQRNPAPVAAAALVGDETALHQLIATAGDYTTFLGAS